MLNPRLSSSSHWRGVLRTARALMHAGIRQLVLTDILSLIRIAPKLENAGAQVLALRVDVSDETDVENLHYVANCAGIMDARKLSDAKPADWDLVVGINLRGVFLCFH
ncbi:hypothetical protein CcaverHIS631_0105160 [Cutaneotrichosporon cavernicola]|nr:hypothetical protein CcaverHIS631_0105160 [Cutaneotrichosporon cavernicola]